MEANPFQRRYAQAKQELWLVIVMMCPTWNIGVVSSQNPQPSAQTDTETQSHTHKSANAKQHKHEHTKSFTRTRTRTQKVAEKRQTSFGGQVTPSFAHRLERMY